MSSPDHKGTPREAFENAVGLLRDGEAGLAGAALAILETGARGGERATVLGSSTHRGDGGGHAVERAGGERPVSSTLLDLASGVRTDRGARRPGRPRGFLRHERGRRRVAALADLLFHNGKPTARRPAPVRGNRSLPATCGAHRGAGRPAQEPRRSPGGPQQDRTTCTPSWIANAAIDRKRGRRRGAGARGAMAAPQT